MTDCEKIEKIFTSTWKIVLPVHNSQLDNNNENNKVSFFVDVASEDKTSGPDLAIVALDVPSYRFWSSGTTVRATIAFFVVVVHAAAIIDDDDVTEGRKC